jgi:hypothetical protein
MATAKTAAKAPARRAPSASTSDIADSGEIVEQTNPDLIALRKPTTAQEDELVTVVVPKAFMLTLDDHTPIAYAAGTQEMPVSHAAHWFARAHGVKVYVAKA